MHKHPLPIENQHSRDSLFIVIAWLWRIVQVITNISLYKHIGSKENIDNNIYLNPVPE